jgi:hypothetical protein
MHNVIQLVSFFLHKNNNAPFYESKCSLDLMKNQKKKKKSFEILKEKAARQNTHF